MVTMSRQERVVAVARTMSVLAIAFPTRTRSELEEAAQVAVDMLAPSPVHVDVVLESREA